MVVEVGMASAYRLEIQTVVTTYIPEEIIRALSVSLLAVAAIAASLLLSRDKRERTLTDSIAPADRELPPKESLDEIRAAGL